MCAGPPTSPTSGKQASGFAMGSGSAAEKAERTADAHLLVGEEGTEFIHTLKRHT
jgi:hypothetical protein